MAPIPTNCGKRFLPKILDELATSDPHRIIYSIAKSTDISDGFREISARVFIDAVNKLAWWLVNQVGKSAKQEVLGYIGPQDLRHVILTHASVKAGYQPLFLSPKNSTEGALALLEASNCQIWVQPVEKPCEQEFIQHRPMRVLNMPELNELLDAQGTKNYTYDPTWEKDSREVFCLLHTSGTTGLPKPISWPHALIGTMDAVRLLPPTEGDGGLLPWTEDWNEGDRIYSAFPMSHGAGIIMNIIVPALFGMHCILGPPGVLPNISLLDSLAEHGKIDVWSIVPSLVDELGDALDVLEKFRPSKFICASGGPVTKVVANKVNKVVRVLNLTGTTEGLFIGNLWVPREDWHWFAFHPYSGFEFKEVEPGVYEHWIHRNEHWELFQGIFHTAVHENSINLKDLYVRHPTNRNLYAYHGRNDDIIVLSNGYKIQPLDMEAIITTHIAVKGCLIVGTGHSQAALLIELNNPAIGNDALFESIWLAVQRANASSLHKDQLHRDSIMFSQPDKPFVRTDKGTVKRAATVKLYEEYISEFYHSRLSGVDVQISAAEIDLTSSESVSNAVAHIIHSLTPKVKDIGDSTDLFEAGLDSLLAVRAVRTVRAAIGLSGEQLSPRHLYANPTIAKFAAAIVRMTSSLTLGDGQGGAENNSAETLEQMKYLLARYKKGFSLKSSGFDLLSPKIYVKMAIYLPTKHNTTRNQVLEVLSRGFERLTSLIPAVDGKVSEFRGQPNSGKKGVQMISIPSHDKHTSKGLSRAATHPERPRQIVSKDLTEQLPSFDELRAKSFVPLFDDELVLDAPWFPERPADIFRAQVNFIRGGVLLVTGLHHSAFDGAGIVTALRAWAECCRFVQGDKSADCSWLHPDSMDRNLVHAQWETEGYAQPAEEIDPETWGYLGFEAPSGLVHKGLQTNLSLLRSLQPHQSETCKLAHFIFPQRSCKG